MNSYTIYCTEEQTKKALEIDAISSSTNEDITTMSCFKLDTPIYTDIIEGGFDYALNPTAEQMKGWLRKKNIFIHICHNCNGYGTWLKKISPSEHIGGLIGYYESEPQAILAAIDAALDYLKNKK